MHKLMNYLIFYLIAVKLCQSIKHFYEAFFLYIIKHKSVINNFEQEYLTKLKKIFINKMFFSINDFHYLLLYIHEKYLKFKQTLTIKKILMTNSSYIYFIIKVFAQHHKKLID